MRFTISFVLFYPQVSDKSISSSCVPLLFLLRSLRQPPLVTATPWSLLLQQRYSSACKPWKPQNQHQKSFRYIIHT